MTNQEKEALLKRIYSLPTEWADGGGSYGKGGPVGSEDAAMLWPEDVIDAISHFAEDNIVPVKQPDPITGLVPCGCGGKAIILCDLEYAVACEKCLIGLPYAFDTEELARQAWNRAIGFERIGGDWEETAI